MQLRFHYIDNLRSIALLLGVLFHAVLAYGPYFNNLWFSADPSKHVIFDYIAMWSHLFRMPLFFLIAGFCAALLIDKRGRTSFIKNRLKRLLLPFVIFFPLSIMLILHAMNWSAAFVDPIPPLFNVFKAVKEPVISTMHLWFLWNLMQFCVLYWLITRWQCLTDTLLAIIVRPWFLCVCLPVLVTIAMFYQMVPFPAPDKLYPQPWAYGLYGTLFLIGTAFYHHHHKLAYYAKYFSTLLILAIIVTVMYFYRLPEPLTLTQVIEAAKVGVYIPQNEVMTVFIQSVAIISWTGVSLLAGYKWLNRHSRVSRYLSDASYWLYLIHIPVLMYIQLPLINVDISVFIKLMISLVGTVAFGLISYHFLVRNTVVGVLLNGQKRAKSRVPCDKTVQVT